MCKESDVQSAVNIALERYGKLNLAVSCAGITGPVHKTYNAKGNTTFPVDDFLKVLSVGTFLHCTEIVHHVS